MCAASGKRLGPLAFEPRRSPKRHACSAPKRHEAFGHLGFVSVLCWADPRRDISVALLNTGKSMAPSALLQLARLLGAIGRAGH